MAFNRPELAQSKTIQKQASKLRWGDLDEEDDNEDFDFLMPLEQVKIGPDDNEIKKKVIENKLNEDDSKVKISDAQLSKRRAWHKFGDGVHEDVGARLTMGSTEEIFLEKPRAPGTKAEESKVAQQEGVALMVCRTCGKKGEHWTARCPYKDLATQTDVFIDKPPDSESAIAPSGPTKGAYVPPSMRANADRSHGSSDMRRKNEENCVRVSNLSEDTREPDLLELFEKVGPVSRVYVAIDQKTGLSRGFGFVNFFNKVDAERAIVKLDGFGYDYLLLRVEWATPRAN